MTTEVFRITAPHPKRPHKEYEFLVTVAIWGERADPEWRIKFVTMLLLYFRHRGCGFFDVTDVVQRPGLAEIWSEILRKNEKKVLEFAKGVEV